jgi:sugar diacid utilization regulator
MMQKGKRRMKRLREFMEEAQQIEEAADIELKPHANGTHYTVHKIHPKSGIEPDQLKVGEKIHDTHVDDLHDMGYKVKIHSK